MGWPWQNNDSGGLDKSDGEKRVDNFQKGYDYWGGVLTGAGIGAITIGRNGWLGAVIGAVAGAIAAHYAMTSGARKDLEDTVGDEIVGCMMEAVEGRGDQFHQWRSMNEYAMDGACNEFARKRGLSQTHPAIVAAKKKCRSICRNWNQAT